MNIVDRKIADLIAAEYNPRQLTTEQYEQLKSSLLRFGCVDPIIVNTNAARKNIIIGGHQRLKVWKDMGNASIPCVELDLPLEKERELNIRLNKNSGEWDWDELANNFDVDDLVEWGFTEDELSGFAGMDPDDVTEDEPPPVPDEAITEPGRIYQLGKHRLMCGDSTSEKDVARLMDGEKADMVFTDPPYALFGNSTGVGGVADDKMVRPFFRDIALAVTANTKEFSHIYSCLDWHSWIPVYESYTANGITVKNMIVWDKERGALGNLYRMQHELILVGINSRLDMNRTLSNAGNKRPVTDVNVWSFPRVSGSDKEHNAAKPVEMMARAITNSSNADGMVIDLFGGSGTTLIACEQTGRACRMMELDPRYCDVIVRRYAALVDADPDEIFKTGVHDA